MKRNYIYAALLYAFTVAVTPAIAGQPQQEKIGRGVVAVKTDEGVFVSWRYLGTDSPSSGSTTHKDSPGWSSADWKPSRMAATP